LFWWSGRVLQTTASYEAGATPEELPDVVARLIKDNAVRQDHAEQVLAELRRIR
jgi:hypothetical protein